MSKFLPGTHQQRKLIGITQHLLNVTILNHITYVSADMTTVANSTGYHIHSFISLSWQPNTENTENKQ